MNKLAGKMSKSELKSELRIARGMLTRCRRQSVWIKAQRDYYQDWNVRVINAMSVAHSKRGLAAFRVTYMGKNGKEKHKLFFTQKRANKFRDSLIPSRSMLIRVEPLYLT